MTLHELGQLQPGTPLAINMGTKRGQTAKLRFCNGDRLHVEFEDGSTSDYSRKACALTRVEMQPAPVITRVLYEKPELKQYGCLLCGHPRPIWNNSGYFRCPICNAVETITEVDSYKKAG